MHHAAAGTSRFCKKEPQSHRRQPYAPLVVRFSPPPIRREVAIVAPLRRPRSTPLLAPPPRQQQVAQIRAVDEAVTSEILGAPGIAPRLKQLGEVGAVDEPIAVEVALTRLQAIGDSIAVGIDVGHAAAAVAGRLLERVARTSVADIAEPVPIGVG